MFVVDEGAEKVDNVEEVLVGIEEVVVVLETVLVPVLVVLVRVVDVLGGPDEPEDGAHECTPFCCTHPIFGGQHPPPAHSICVGSVGQIAIPVHVLPFGQQPSSVQ